MPSSQTASDRADDAIIDAATNAGFKIAVPCRLCGTYLVAPLSVRYRLGPKCRAKLAEQEAA